MKKIALIYSFNARDTAAAADIIFRELGENNAVRINVEEVTDEQFLRYDYMILGVPTWWDGELPNYWDEFVPALEDMDLRGKTFALFGHGDQKGYPQSFGDAIGILAELLENRGATLTGITLSDGYEFERSKALKEHTFVGLLLDSVNQPELTDKRIKDWIAKIKPLFRIK
ncbi:MAG: flavodoxin [Bacteroidetes bacterium]|nr:flavodoxin [Bacteroidota bacterium]